MIARAEMRRATPVPGQADRLMACAEAAVARARTHGRAFAVASAQSESADLFTADGDERAALLYPAGGPREAVEIGASGAAAVIEARGPGRFERVRREAAALFGAVMADPDAPAPARPRLVGGFAFSEAGEGWPGFPGARFVLPARTVVRDASGTWVTAVVRVDADDVAVEVAARLAALLEPRGWRAEGLLPFVRAAGAGQLDAWRAGVARARAAIAAGRLEKVVLARAAAYEAEAPVSPAVLLAAFRRAEPAAVAYLISPAGAGSLVGATPERLVRLASADRAQRATPRSPPISSPAHRDRAVGNPAPLASPAHRDRAVGDPAPLASPAHPERSPRRSAGGVEGGGRRRDFQRGGRLITTGALAGTAPRGATAGEDRALARRLRASAKERAEHAIVADAIVRALRDLAPRVRRGRRRVLRLAHVQHLFTPIEADLARGAPVHVLDLAARLHPTPAVAGAPREAALAHLAAGEGPERGWYAGGIGWFDARGDGDLFVAIRAAHVAGPGEPPGVRLFAGAGIVAGSDAESEWRETEAKLRALAGALGGQEGSRAKAQRRKGRGVVPRGLAASREERSETGRG